ncbi:hypothetical protein [Lysinibacter sp. HNR]|nr:hypothetical protein [Lysinibacter sp. HNR]WGD36866.1 hypothetical protein FrondiHNR_10480 [Lysinibacter sp. HNR]
MTRALDSTEGGGALPGAAVESCVERIRDYFRWQSNGPTGALSNLIKRV